MNLGEQLGFGVLAGVGAFALGAIAVRKGHEQLMLNPAQDNLDCAEALDSNTNHDTANLPKVCSERYLSEYITGPDTSREVWGTDAGGQLSKINSNTINYGSTEKIVTDARVNLEAVRAEQDNYTVTGGVIGLVALGACVVWRLSRKHRYGVHSEIDSQDIEPPTKAPFQGPTFPAQL